MPIETDNQERNREPSGWGRTLIILLAWLLFLNLFLERFVTLYGMSEKLGPVAFEKMQQQFLEGLTNPRRAVSPKIAEAIDCEVKEIVEGAHQVALAILADNRDLLEETAQVLLEKEIIEGEELKGKLKRVKRFTGVEAWLLSGHLSPEMADTRQGTSGNIYET